MRSFGVVVCPRMPQAFSDKDLLERDWLPNDRTEYNLSVYVRRITVQPSKYKPVKNLEPVELEILQLKRAVVSIETKEDSKEAQITAIIEFRGKGLTLSRTNGDCDVAQLAWRLSRFHFSRYRKAGLRILSPPDSHVLCDCTLENPQEFLDFLKLIHTNGGLTVRVWQETEQPFHGIRQRESYKLGSKAPQVFP
jgi:hypothetical protein